MTLAVKKNLAVAGVLAVGASLGAYAFWDNEEDIADTSFNGAYRLADGSIITLGPSTSERLRLVRYDNGEVQSLYHGTTGTFEAANGFSSRDTVATGSFEYSEQGVVTGASWLDAGVPSSISRMPLRSEVMEFQSGDLRLRGKLTLPEGDGPFAVVIMVHGSEHYSAVDYYQQPYMLAANGIAGFKFDKRGTGGSEGDYTQHFPTLAGDVVAAANHLKARGDIDPDRINLAGFSQGGWIAPLVAKQMPIRSIMVGFGCAVSVPREDRWGYVKQLQDRGFGAAEIALADAMNAELDAIVDHADDAAWDRLFALRDQYIDEEWFRSLVGSDSFLGFIAGKATAPGASWMPGFGWKLYYRWKTSDGPNFNRTYDPRVTLNEITTPSLWLLAGEDSSVPTGETTIVLDELRAAGKPVEYKVYAGAEHGNVLFVVDDEGERRYTGYVPDYFTDTVEWFKTQNGVSGS